MESRVQEEDVTAAILISGMVGVIVGLGMGLFFSYEPTRSSGCEMDWIVIVTPDENGDGKQEVDISDSCGRPDASSLSP